MSELNKKCRVCFPPGEQSKFLEKGLIFLGCTVKQYADLLNISTRQLQDWQKEKNTLPLHVVQIICQKTGFDFPSHAKVVDRFWYTTKAGSMGGKAIYKKYGHIGGDPENRKRQWYKWWESVGKHDPESLPNIRKNVKHAKHSKNLAEFVGILLGDGGMTQRQIAITLHQDDDREYRLYVAGLIEKLFHITPSIYIHTRDKGCNIVISRTGLVEFFVEMGLPIGNKITHKIDIPEWIKDNEKFSASCMRGLFDTDGCVVIHRYRVRNKEYVYKKLMFTSYSMPLLMSVKNLLEERGYSVRQADKKYVWIDSQKHVKRYFQDIGSNNPKHLKRYEK